MIVTILKPGTLCVTVGGTGENAGRIVTVLSYFGPHDQNSAITEGYIIRTASGRPFASIRRYTAPARYDIARNACSQCIADRSNLRPLVDLKADAEEQTIATPCSKNQKAKRKLATEV